MRGLDKQILDALTLVGVLLLFVIAYFSAVFPYAAQIFAAAGRPAPETDITPYMPAVRSFRNVTIVAASLPMFVLLVLVPLNIRIIKAGPFSSPFDTLRAGFLLVDLFLLFSIVMGVSYAVRLQRVLSNFHFNTAGRYADRHEAEEDETCILEEDDIEVFEVDDTEVEEAEVGTAPKSGPRPESMASSSGSTVDSLTADRTVR